MKSFLLLLAAIITFSGCKKECDSQKECNIKQTYVDNAKKATITTGVWGTVSSIEGNCMPTIGGSNSCTNCPVKRTVQIYEYTLSKNASQIGYSTLYSSFNSPLVAQVETDKNGFYQVALPAGKYSIAIVEEDKLYSNSWDDQNGLTPVTIINGREKLDVAMTYKAAF